MKVAVFGVETKDGLSFVKHAARVGFNIQLLATNTTPPTKLSPRNIRAISGTYCDDDVLACLSACDAAVVLMNELVDHRCLNVILSQIKDTSISRFILCDDRQRNEDYEDYDYLTRTLTQSSLDWTLIKRAHQDMEQAIKQIDTSLTTESRRHNSFVSYVVNQITDSSRLGATVILTN